MARIDLLTEELEYVSALPTLHIMSVWPSGWFNTFTSWTCWLDCSSSRQKLLLKWSLSMQRSNSVHVFQFFLWCPSDRSWLHQLHNILCSYSSVSYNFSIFHVLTLNIFFNLRQPFCTSVPCFAKTDIEKDIFNDAERNPPLTQTIF